jgi:hypothetical protein
MCEKVRPLLFDFCQDAATGRYIFENLRAGLAIHDIKHGYTSAIREAGIKDLTFHDLRHTWSTRAAEPGVLGSLEARHPRPFTRFDNRFPHSFIRGGEGASHRAGRFAV